MIDLGALNEYTQEKLELAERLKEFGFSDEEVSAIIKKSEQETIRQEGVTHE
jgi:hypothetical protein